ncbi:MAG: hypothetical protein UMR38_05750 [Candidatus Izemoplasma sp.]|nr:hypothetical protein [Candidatus Izemoplasma sp.]
MINLATVVILVFSFTSSIYFNYQRRLEADINDFPSDSIVDGLLTFIVLYALFLQGYIAKTYVVLALIFALLAVGYIRFINENAFHKYDELLETTRNNVILFLRTLGLFFVLLTVFRFQHAVLQIILSVTIVLLLNYMTYYYQDNIANFFEKIKLQFSIASYGTFAVIWIIGGIIIAQFVFLNYPFSQLKDTINLNDNVPYFRYEDYSPTIINNQEFSVSKEWVFDYEDIVLDNISHFYETDEYILFYDGRIANKDHFYSLNKSTGELESFYYKDDSIASVFVNNDTVNSQIFYSVDDEIIMFGNIGIWQFNKTRNTITNISNITSATLDQNVFIKDDNLHYFMETDANSVDIYQYGNNTFNFLESLDLDSLNFEGLTTINNTLFYETAEKYVLYNDTTLQFEKTTQVVSYSPSIETMYSANYKEVSNETIFTVQTRNDRFTKTVKGKQNWIPLSANGYGYFVTVEEFDHVSVIDSTNKHIAYVDLYEPKRFFPELIDYEKDLIHIYTTEAGIRYLKAETVEASSFIIGSVEYRSVMMPFTIYGSMSFTHLFICLTGLIIPFSDIRKEVTEVSFQAMLKKKTKKDEYDDFT